MSTFIMPYKKQLAAMLGDVQELTCLDYGCGAGDFVEILLNQPRRPKHIYAVDSDVDMIRKVKSRFVQAIEDGVVIAELVADPKMLVEKHFDRIICHNVLECISEKLSFINCFNNLLTKEGLFLLSHHDFDSTIFNSQDKALTRALIHAFSDTKQTWQEHCDGQMGRKIPGLLAHSVFSNRANFQTIRIVETEFEQGQYGYLLADMILSELPPQFEENILEAWVRELKAQAKNREYYFAIDLVVAMSKKA